MELTLKGMMRGWGDIGECELGTIQFANGIDISLPHTEEVLAQQNRPYYEYSIWFVPPKRKRPQIMCLSFDKYGHFTEFKVVRGKFTKKQMKEWKTLFSDWLIENEYAIERG